MDTKNGATIKLGGKEYKLLLTTRATKEVAKRYGGLENLGDKMASSENLEQSLGDVIWLVTLLANQAIAVHNYEHPDDKRPDLSEEIVEILTKPKDIGGFSSAILDAISEGTGRVITSEEEPGKNAETE